MEVDIYGDIENFDFGEQLEKVRHENNELRNTIQRLQKAVDDFSKELARLKTANANLEFNISALYGTAKAEFDRKNKQFSQLRKDFDGLFKSKKENIASKHILQQNEKLRQEIERNKKTINMKVRIISSLTNELDNLKKQLSEKNGPKRDSSHFDFNDDVHNSKRQKLQSPEIENQNETRSNTERSHRSRSPKPEHFSRRTKYFKSGFNSRNKFRHPESFRRSNFLNNAHTFPSKYRRSSRSRSRTPMADNQYNCPKKIKERRKSSYINKDDEFNCSSTEINTVDDAVKNYEEELKAYKIFHFQSENKNGEAKSKPSKEIVPVDLDVNSNNEEVLVPKKGSSQFKNENFCVKSFNKEQSAKEIYDCVSEPEDGELNTSLVDEENSNNSSEKSTINNNSQKKKNPILEKNCLTDNKETSTENKITDNYKNDKRKDLPNTDTNNQKLYKEKKRENNDEMGKKVKKVEQCQKTNIMEKKKDDLEKKWILNSDKIHKEIKKVEQCQKSIEVFLENKLMLNKDTPSCSKDCKETDNLQMEKDDKHIKIKTNKNVDLTREKKHPKFDSNYKIPKTKNEISGPCKEIKSTNEINRKITTEKDKQINNEDRIAKSNKLKEKLSELFEEVKKYQTTESSDKNKKDPAEVKAKPEAKVELPKKELTKDTKNSKLMSENNVEKEKNIKKDDLLMKNKVELEDMSITELNNEIIVLTSEISKLVKVKEEEKVKKLISVNEEIKKTKVRIGLGTGKPRSFLKHAKEYEKHKIVFSPQAASYQKQLNDSSVTETTLEETFISSVTETPVEQIVQPSTTESTLEKTVQIEKLPITPGVTTDRIIPETITKIPLNKSFESNVISSAESVAVPLIEKTNENPLNKGMETNNPSLKTPPIRGRRRRRCIITITKRTD